MVNQIKVNIFDTWWKGSPSCGIHIYLENRYTNTVLLFNITAFLFYNYATVNLLTNDFTSRDYLDDSSFTIINCFITLLFKEKNKKHSSIRCVQCYHGQAVSCIKWLVIVLFIQTSWNRINQLVTCLLYTSPSPRDRG